MHVFHLVLLEEIWRQITVYIYENICIAYVLFIYLFILLFKL